MNGYIMFISVSFIALLGGLFKTLCFIYYLPHISFLLGLSLFISIPVYLIYILIEFIFISPLQSKLSIRDHLYNFTILFIIILILMLIMYFTGDTYYCDCDPETNKLFLGREVRIETINYGRGAYDITGVNPPQPLPEPQPEPQPQPETPNPGPRN